MDVHPTKNVSIGIDPYPLGLRTMRTPGLKGVKKASEMGVAWLSD